MAVAVIHGSGSSVVVPVRWAMVRATMDVSRSSDSRLCAMSDGVDWINLLKRRSSSNLCLLFGYG